jgi:hypothetical protein
MIYNVGAIFQRGIKMVTATVVDNSQRKFGVGRPRKDPSETIRIRIATAALVRRVAGLLGVEAPDLLDEILLPELNKRLQEEAKKIIDSAPRQKR